MLGSLQLISAAVLVEPLDDFKYVLRGNLYRAKCHRVIINETRMLRKCGEKCTSPVLTQLRTLPNIKVPLCFINTVEQFVLL